MRTDWSVRRSSSVARRRVAYSSGGGASGSTPSSTIRRSINRRHAGWAFGPRCTFRSSCAGGRWESSSLTTSWVRPRASATTTSGSPSRSQRARQRQLTCPNASAGMLSAASSRRRRLERARLARELHDETGQALTSILLGLKSLEERVEIRRRRSCIRRATRPRGRDTARCPAAGRGVAPGGAGRLRAGSRSRTPS